MDALNKFCCYPETMNPVPVSVLIIESHPLMREALCTAIASEPDFKLAGQAANGAEMSDMAFTTHSGVALLTFKPDIILLALGNPGLTELDTLKTLRKNLPDIAILALTSSEVPGQEEVALQAGAQAALGKSAPRAELLQTLRSLRTFSMDIQKLDFEQHLDQYLSHPPQISPPND